jgi:hypothetical protein
MRSLVYVLILEYLLSRWRTNTTSAPVSPPAIIPLNITGILVDPKIYNGNNSAQINIENVTFNGLIPGDSINISSATAVFNNENAGDMKPVVITITLGGKDASKYDSPNILTTATITPATITAITGITAESKIYDGTTDAILSVENAGFTGIVEGDTLSVATSSGEFVDKNAGLGKPVNITGLTLGGTDLSNYTLGSSTASIFASITKSTISAITGITAESKTYDGTTDVTFSVTNAVFTGIIEGDTLSVATSSGAFVDKNAGLGKPVNITGLTLGGTDVGNYTLGSSTASIFASITQSTISAITGITAESKTYDGTTDAILSVENAVFTGIIEGDTLSVATSSGAFVDKNAGLDKPVNITGLTLGGTDVGNYTLGSSSSASIFATITPATITAITGITAVSRTYDGTPTATLGVSMYYQPITYG